MPLRARKASKADVYRVAAALPTGAGELGGNVSAPSLTVPAMLHNPRITLMRELAAVTGPLRSTELIYCWDPDGSSDPRGFARADHCDHIHVGWDT